MLLLVSVSCPITLNKKTHDLTLVLLHLLVVFVVFSPGVVSCGCSFDVSIEFSTVYFWVVCVWCSLGVVMYVLFCKCCGDATIFLPWVLHFWGCGFATGGVILGVGNILN